MLENDNDVNTVTALVKINPSLGGMLLRSRTDAPILV